jgi:hypothetical protein
MLISSRPIALFILAAHLVAPSCGGTSARGDGSVDTTPGDASACNSPGPIVAVMTAANSPAPYAASGSPTYGGEYPVWSLFDGKTTNGDSHWISSSLPAYAQLDAGAPKSVVAYTMVGRFDTLKDRLPKSWRLEGSNNASAGGSAAWMVIDSRSGVGVGEGGWLSTTSQASLNFVLPAAVQYSSFRLTVAEVGGSSVADLIELQLWNSCTDVHTTATPGDASPCNSPGPIVAVMTAANLPAPYVASGSPTYGGEYPVWSLFDGKTTNGDSHWISSSLPAYAQLDAGAPKSVVAYTLVGRFDVLKDRLPKTWKLEGSNNASAGGSATWMVIDSRSGVGVGEGGWLSTTSQASLNFVLPAAVQYSSFRLTVAEVGGSSVADLIELQLWNACTDT